MAVLAHPWLYAGFFAGDAEIHLVYGESAAAGRFFQFNPGETSPGVTSPGYMLLVASLFAVIPARFVPVILVGLGYVAWYLLLLLVYKHLRRAGLERRWAVLGGVVLGLLPGTAYNSVVGMENVLFASLMLAWLLLAFRWGYFEPQGASSRGGLAKELALGAALGLSVWIRPEAAFLEAVAIVYGLVLAASERRLAGAIGPTVWSASSFLLLVGALAGFHHHYTGVWLPGSGKARIMMASLESFSFGPVRVDPKFTVRLLMYLPLTAFAAVGYSRTIRAVRNGEKRTAEVVYGLILGVYFMLYTFVFGAAHLARYTIFLMPLVVMPAVIGVKVFWEGAVLARMGRFTVPVLLGAALFLGAVFAIEMKLRTEQGGSRRSLANAMAAPENRKAASDRLMAELGAQWARPVVLAYQEVQARYRLDERFTIRSLDGRVDPVLLRFFHDGSFDHVGYLRVRKVDYLMAYPNYNRDPAEWALSSLARLKPGESAIRDGLRFEKLASAGNITRIELVGSP